MANIYVRSTDGNNADNGSTWALAKATLAGAVAIAAAGDTIWVSQVHAESDATTQNYSMTGTRASPLKVLCGNDAAEPPTAAATSATLSTTTTAVFNFSSSTNGSQYLYGLTFNSGSGASAASFFPGSSSNSEIVFESCDFVFVGTGASLMDCVATSAGHLIHLKNCRVKFGATTQALQLRGNGSVQFYWQGGSFISGTSSPNTANNAVFAFSVGNGSVTVEGVDFSNLGTGVHLANGGSSSSGPLNFVVRDCKLPSGWTGSLVRQSVTGSSRYSLYNCSSSSQNYKLWVECAEGTVRDETTLVRTNGATDGVTPLAWKMTASANNVFPVNYLVSDEIMFFVSSIGSAVTAVVHVLHDSATNLTDADIWLELSYLGSSTTPLGTFATDRAADPLATAVDQTVSLAAWTTTGMANPNKQQLSVTFTPQMAGFINARICLAKASKVVYICPKVEIV